MLRLLPLLKNCLVRAAFILPLLVVLLPAGCDKNPSDTTPPATHDGPEQQIPEPPPEAVPPPPEKAPQQEPSQADVQTQVDLPSPPPQAAPAVVRREEKEAPGAIQDPRREHGQNPVLRSRTQLKRGAKESYPLVKPDWTKPYDLNFTKLIGNYRYYQLHGEFFEKGLPRLHGGAITLSGAVMPIDPPGQDGKLARFWLANPLVVMAGCVFCNPPTLGDLVYVEANPPLVVDREELYKSVVTAKLLGRLFIDGGRDASGLEYLYRMELKKVLR